MPFSRVPFFGVHHNALRVGSKDWGRLNVIKVGQSGSFPKGLVPGRLRYVAAAGLLTFVCHPGTAGTDGIVPPTCPGDEKCYKEMRIVNNTENPLFPVIQASIQTQQFPGCTTADGGDIWLQAALKNKTECFPVKNTYYLYINPTAGIPSGQTASIKLPWYSKLVKPNPDEYIDWWRAGRNYIFDDKKALDESYLVNSSSNGNKVDPGTPWVSCASLANNVCDPNDLKVYRIDGLALKGSDIQTQTPFQLNEYTFADVTPAGVLLNLAMNYNVSNVDQLYLPLALEPISPGFPVGWMGSALTVKDWRAKLEAWTGANADQTDAKNWPIYNNPIMDTHTKERLYPKAGIRVPSALTVFNFYMSPYYINGDTKLPQIIPSTRPKYAAAIETNWDNCTTPPFKDCPLHDMYAPIKTVFDNSYSQYLATCWERNKSPAWLAPVKETKLPSPEAYARFVQGWVPFRADGDGPGQKCDADDVRELPQASDPPNPPERSGAARVNYVRLQYDFHAPLNAKGDQLFNPYTQLVHEVIGESAYAFSVDDDAGLHKSEGTGMIFEVGGFGHNPLPNINEVPPAVPAYYDWYTAGVSLGWNKDFPKRGWLKYGVCKDAPDTDFPDINPGTIGLNPRTTPVPCVVSLKGTDGIVHRIKLLQMNHEGPLPYQIWDEWSGDKPGARLNPKTIACPDDDPWCTQQTNEVAHRPAVGAPTFTTNSQEPTN